MAGKVYVGDVGTQIVLDCGQDISAASVRKIEVRKPDKTEVSWTATASGTNAVAFITLADTLNMAGVWQMQAHVTLPSGEWRGETAPLRVYAKFL